MFLLGNLTTYSLGNNIQSLAKANQMHCTHPQLSSKPVLGNELVFLSKDGCRALGT